LELSFWDLLAISQRLYKHGLRVQPLPMHPILYKETIMKIEYTTKKDLIKQIEDKGFKPLSMNATIQDMKIYLLALNVEATLKKVAKQVTK